MKQHVFFEPWGGDFVPLFFIFDCNSIFIVKKILLCYWKLTCAHVNVKKKLSNHLINKNYTCVRLIPPFYSKADEVIEVCEVIQQGCDTANLSYLHHQPLLSSSSSSSSQWLLPPPLLDWPIWANMAAGHHHGNPVTVGMRSACVSTAQHAAAPTLQKWSQNITDTNICTEDKCESVSAVNRDLSPQRTWMTRCRTSTHAHI